MAQVGDGRFRYIRERLTFAVDWLAAKRYRLSVRRDVPLVDLMSVRVEIDGRGCRLELPPPENFNHMSQNLEALALRLLKRGAPIFKLAFCLAI